MNTVTILLNNYYAYIASALHYFILLYKENNDH